MKKACGRPMKNKLLIIIAAFWLSACEQKEPIAADYLLLGGQVFTGHDEPAFKGDVAIKGDQIVFVGDVSEANVVAAEKIDVTGRIVAPGFIDIHTHSFEELLREEGPGFNENYLTQGITTVFSGNDGRGPANISQVLTLFEQRGLGTNMALFVGHGAVRWDVLGDEDRAPTADELARMKSLVDQAMQQGALGLSTGLYYAPGSFSETSEVIELAKVVAGYNGIYDSHIRDESTYTVGLKTAVQEALDIGKAADIPVHFAHIKALGVDVWGQSRDVVAMIEQAQSEGLHVTADQYPWTASGTRISNALVPRWAMGGGKEALYDRLQDEKLLPGLKEEIRENIRKRGGGTALLLTRGTEEMLGRTLAEYAKQQNLNEVDAAIQIVLAGDAGVASFNMNDGDIEYFMKQPWVMTGSDAGSGHPRKYASYPRKYQVYVKEKQTISMVDFIHRSTGMVAQTFGLCDRGYLDEGYKADVIVLDADGFQAKADFQNPHVLSEGVIHAFVNGQMTITSGRLLGTLPGKALIKSPDGCS